MSPNVLSQAGAQPIDRWTARWEKHNQERQTRILDAAAELIRENPPAAIIPIQQIAERAGLAKSVVYRQFEGRDDLDRRVRSHIAACFADELESAIRLEDSSAEEILHAMIDLVVGWELDERSLREFLRSGPAADDTEPDALSSLRARVAKQSGETIAVLAKLIGIEDQRFDTTAFAVVSMVDGAAARWAGQPDPKPSRGELVDELVSYAWAVLDSVVRAHGFEVSPRQPVVEVLGQLATQNVAG